MAEWKKIVVSGSDISQLTNDSGYLSGSQNIASASVAARATTLSADATASFALVAGTARAADSASVAARATLLSDLATASFADVAGTSRNADSASVAARATTLSDLATASFADLASDARTATSASIAALASTLSATATASYADVAGDARTATSASIASTADSASVAARATTLSNLATASFADVAGTARNADSASVAARATELSVDATASFANLASTVHDGNITTAKIADGNVTNVKLANDSVTLGTTEITLGTTATSISGLTSISSTTGSFVLQIFESSSTIITSGSNIFGDKQDDIQQITGSLKQTGSFTLSGSLLQSNGVISGSFQGDGSGLTGLATNLTVDGDTGTQDVDLLQDDLQILGTTDEIVTAVTKVGNDVKVTLSLPDTVAVTASVATRANALSPLATASYADVASVARNADSASVAARATTLSADATASYALLASDARTSTSASFATQAGTSRAADSASVAARATLLSADATASYSLLASDARTSTSASISALASTLSPTATASFADVAGTVHDGNITTAKIADGNVTNIKLANDSVTLGTTEVTLGTTITSISGLNSISATTGSFVLQIFESSSTIITSGSNIFGDKQDDIQQFTGSIKQSGSFTLSGSLLQSNGTISGSFEGDGSGLTGVTADTAASSSVAARATALSADATASYALLASDARTATSASIAALASTLSATATASFADVAGTARAADSASVAARATLLSADATASFADLASDARTATSASIAATAGTASVADRATLLSDLATASFADVAGTARTTDSASVAARATTLSADATASYADLAGTVHDGNITNAKIADTTIANVKLVNDSITFGSTAQALGTTVSTLSGLDLISATTGTFVLQVYESSSTIITSGSNIFGNDQNDIQQITGSLKQTGSFTISGSILQSHGTISGSFEGDGSGLTGLATVLTVDGDTGTQDVDLISDDLQIIGTANEIETAVTKVGNDVKVTLGLPDSVDVTASVATRADELSPLATASIADTATTASHAITAVSASATVAGDLFPTTAGLEGQTIVLNNSGEFVYGDAFGTGSTKKLNQSVAASTWSFQHNLNEVYPIVQAYDSDGDQLIPERVESIDANNVKLYFAENTAGIAAAMVGGMGVSASHATQADSASVAARATTLSADATASFADLASDARTSTSASIAALASTLSATATASFADLAGVARNADSASVAARATTLSDLATASFADSATTASQADSATSASHALGGAGTFSGSFLGDGSGLTGLASNFNFDGDSGATTINLLTETASFNGTAQEIETTVTANTLTIGLPDNVTIGNNLTVTNNATVGGNLIVNGSIVSASSLAIADQFIILASGSNGAIDGGIIVNQIDDDPDGKGVAFAYDSSANRWALETGLNDTASVITPDAYMGVIQEFAGAPSSDPVYGGTSGKGTIFVDTNNNEAYIYI
jgi:trimeric autotransporter adhesin